jgi:DNA-directed RNA polymerase specialized sigma24 family protein
VEWLEFYNRVEELPADQREVFELRCFGGLKNVEIAGMLGKTDKAVSRLWIAATEKLLEAVPGLEPEGVPEGRP